MNVVVYCSSQRELEDVFVDSAQLAGRVIADAGCRLLYGGVDAGLMHTVALAASQGGAEIEGVVPQCFAHRADKLVTRLRLSRDLGERKSIMINDGDIFVVLPGGLGTIDEFFSTLTHLEITGDTRRKIIIVNINGIFDAMLTQLDETACSKFARSDSFRQIYTVASNCEDFERILISHINNYEKE